jgi:hypothetical protein
MERNLWALAEALTRSPAKNAAAFAGRAPKRKAAAFKGIHTGLWRLRTALETVAGPSASPFGRGDYRPIDSSVPAIYVSNEYLKVSSGTIA